MSKTETQTNTATVATATDTMSENAIRTALHEQYASFEEMFNDSPETLKAAQQLWNRFALISSVRKGERTLDQAIKKAGTIVASLKPVFEIRQKADAVVTAPYVTPWLREQCSAIWKDRVIAAISSAPLGASPEDILKAATKALREIRVKITNFSKRGATKPLDEMVNPTLETYASASLQARRDEVTEGEVLMGYGKLLQANDLFQRSRQRFFLVKTAADAIQALADEDADFFHSSIDEAIERLNTVEEQFRQVDEAIANAGLAVAGEVKDFEAAAEYNADAEMLQKDAEKAIEQLICFCKSRPFNAFYQRYRADNPKETTNPAQQRKEARRQLDKERLEKFAGRHEAVLA